MRRSVIGQVLQYCKKLLTMDPSRTFVYALLTDLTHCFLFRVRPCSNSGFSLSMKTEVSHPFPWLTPDPTAVSGLTVLTTLASMSLENLGMAANVKELAVFHIRRWLGAGATAWVYEAISQSSQRYAVKVSRHRARLAVRHEEDESVAREMKVFANELAVLTALNAGEAEAPSGRVTALGRQLGNLSVTFNGLHHIPELLRGQTEVAGTIQLQPVALPLRPSNVDEELVQDLLATLQWLHKDKKYLHGDVSYRNLMLARKGWRGGSALHLEELSLLLIDWGYARPIETAGQQSGEDARITGTPACMSRKTLYHWCKMDDGQPYQYTIADELESAVKSVLLVAWPWFKARLHAQVKLAASRGMRRGSYSTGKALIDFWKPLDPKIYELCLNEDYKGLQLWLNKVVFSLHVPVPVA